MFRRRSSPTSYNNHPTNLGTKAALVAASTRAVGHHLSLVGGQTTTFRQCKVTLPPLPLLNHMTDWSLVTAATLLSVAPLLIAFLLFQRQFVQSFMRAGTR